MSLAAPDIALLIIELLTALALLALWVSDRERSYMLWWAIAHATLPLVSMQVGHIRDFPTPSMFLVLSLVMSTQAVCLLAGVISYRTGQLSARHAGAAIVALTALMYLPSHLLGVMWTRGFASLVMVAALTCSASLLWSLGRFERLAAICLGLRALLATALMVLMATGSLSPEEAIYVPSFTMLLATGTVLALLIAAYRRSLVRLRQQYRILELTQELTAQLQGITDEAELAQCVLKILSQRLHWERAAFLILTPQPMTFRPIATLGVKPEHMIQDETIQIQAGGLVSIALNTQSVQYSNNLLHDPRVSEPFREHRWVATMPSQAVVPITHNAEILGVVVLRDTGQRELSDAELLTLKSLGQVIGLSLTNTRNLNELAHRANHDALTGLGSRAALHDYLRSFLHDTPQDQHQSHLPNHLEKNLHTNPPSEPHNDAGKQGAVLLFDLDHFKQVNDALGHTVGDQLLQALATRLQQYLADHPAQLFRLGGDEFVIIHQLDECTPDTALKLAREIFDVIAQPLQIGELSLRTPASVGVALAPEHGDSHELLRCADVAMYHAKHNGTGVALYERSIDAHKLEHLTLLSAVDEGLDKNQFELFYQPFINLTTGAIEGCEGLARWRHPTLGLIGAAEFMPLIEATDLIRGLTHRVIDIAMCDAARWQLNGIETRIAINLSARNILDSELPTYLLNAAAQRGVDPRRIQLEITETILIKDPAAAGKVLQQLAEAGFSLALDDFGTGYSSLAYLARFPIHTLKIDRSFVREMLTHPQSRTIVESTIALAHGLGLKVTAEGVEQEEEANLLRELGCDHAQGYLFSRPVPESQLIEQWWPKAVAAAP